MIVDIPDREDKEEGGGGGGGGKKKSIEQAGAADSNDLEITQSE